MNPGTSATSPERAVMPGDAVASTLPRPGLVTRAGLPGGGRPDSSSTTRGPPGRIGAAYGFTSAIVSALALAGVAASLIVRNRQARAEQIQGIRTYYLELVRLELDDMALFRPVWGDTAGASARTCCGTCSPGCSPAGPGATTGAGPTLVDRPYVGQPCRSSLRGHRGRGTPARARRRTSVTLAPRPSPLATDPPPASAPGASHVWGTAAGALLGLGAGWALGSRLRLHR
ncbi:DUF6082 family protein [Streptomyces sp. NPDC002574]|uniref:DUF6082 family protein n=1 Tax=Streptomyces sp. NPDC002574 TaxID=3364652 RepID=UPI003689BE60